MITLITGTPGAGKTAYAVAELAKLAKESNRPIYVLGVPDLTVRHELVGPVEDWTSRVPVPGHPGTTEAQFTFPDGALIVLDECQNIFRPRAASVRVPDHVSAFEKHRHKGLDFWLITQHPNLLDSSVRRLCGKHIHLRGHWAGRELLEWADARDPESRGERATAVRVKYKLPASAFALYKSASLHVKVKRRIPKALYVLALLLVAGAVLGYRVYGRVSDAVTGKGLGDTVSQLRPGEALPVAGATVAGTVELGMASFVPRLVGRPETAPLYDELRQVVALPSVVGCLQLRKRCSCFNAQGTDAGYSTEACQAWLAAPPFNPFRQTFPAPPGAGEGQQGAASAPPMPARRVTG